MLVRIHPDMLDRLDAWCAQQEDKPTRPEGLRRLAEKGLGKVSRG